MGRGLEGVAGGIGWLRRLLSEHGGAVTRDLLCAGLHLRDIGTERLSWDELAAFVKHSPPHAAISRVADPDWWITGPVQILREAEHGLRVLAWLKTEDATKRVPRNYPERLAITAVEQEAERLKHAPEYDVTPIAEMADFLGWPRPKSA